MMFLIGLVILGYCLPELLILSGGQGRSPVPLNIATAVSLGLVATQWAAF